MKRSLDILGGLIGLLFAAPILLILGLLVRVGSPGPAIFSTERIGLNGRPFTFYKLRSMRRDASTVGPYFTVKDDPRITPIGRFLRKTSLDELPQLWNVVRGDMSLVGPRPAPMAQREQYTEEEWRLRCSVKPGVTGLAQVIERSSGRTRRKIDLDLDYVARQSFVLDLWIIWRTVFVVLSGKATN